MPTKSSSTTKSSSSRGSAAASIRSGSVPPYGVAIRDAIARGDAGEMKTLASASRKYLNDVQSALAKLEAAIGQRR
jgi:hypothetical protein